MRLRYTLPVLFVLLLLLAARGHAATNLPVTCSRAEVQGQFVGACNTGATAATGHFEYYTEALPDTLVRTCKPTGCDWNDPATFRYQRFKDVPATMYVDTCADDIPSWSRDPFPWDFATSTCKNWHATPKKDVAQLPLATGGAATSAALTWTRAKWGNGTDITEAHSYTIFRRVPKLTPPTAASYETALASVVGFAATVPNQAGVRCFSIVTNVGALSSSPSPEICKQFRPTAPSNGRIEAPSNGSIQPKP